jgi:hypothetical protein
MSDEFLPPFEAMKPAEFLVIAKAIGSKFTNHPMDKGLAAMGRMFGITRTAIGRYADGSREISPPLAKLFRYAYRHSLSPRQFMLDTNKSVVRHRKPAE